MNKNKGERERERERERKIRRQLKGKKKVRNVGEVKRYICTELEEKVKRRAWK